MSSPWNLQELLYSAEVSFCVNAEAASSNTWSDKLPVKSMTVELSGERVTDTSLRSRSDEENLGHVGTREWSADFTFYWPGHLAATTGALTETWLQDMISDGLGGGNTTQGGTTANAGTHTTTSVGLTGGTATVGCLMRFGAKGDARGDGQASVISAYSGGTATLLCALPAAPTSTDVIYATMAAYHDESTLTTLGTKRFCVAHVVTGAQYHLMGGQLAGVSISMPIAQNGLPEITLRYRGAYWQRQATTTPNSATLRANYCAPIAGGSVFVNDVGTSTRAVLTPSSMDLAIDLGLEPIPGPGGNGSLQYITGWVRTIVRPKLRMTIPWVTDYETWWDTSNASIAYKHILATLNVDNGVRSVAFYMPRCFPSGKRPSQPVESNRQVYVPVEFTGVRGATTTNALTESSIRFCAG